MTRDLPFVARSAGDTAPLCLPLRPGTGNPSEALTAQSSGAAAVALYVAHYNLCRVHEALRITPAMQLGVTDHVWTVGELVDAALNPSSDVPQGRRYGRFMVIDGGR